MSAYDFTTRWFDDCARPVWDQLLPQIRPRTILEIGSYEGASACYLIDSLCGDADGRIELHCLDNWEGGLEHRQGGTAEANMGEVETRFMRNIKIAWQNAEGRADVKIHKGFSDDSLISLLASGLKNHFDFIYIDGSHQASDVLSDAILSFKLLKVGGYMVFDDYIWSEPLDYGQDLVRCPKLAIDAFTNIFCRKTRILSAPLYQLYLQKTDD